MRWSKAIVWGGVSFGVLFLTSSSVAQGVGFSAQLEQVTTATGGQRITRAARFFQSSDGRTREETELGATVIDVRARTVTVLSHERKHAIVFEMPAGSVEASKALRPYGQMSTTVDQYEGRAIRRVRYREERTDIDHEVWHDDVLRIAVVTIVSRYGSISERRLRNIAVGEPDANLFLVPDGYTVRRGTDPPRSVATVKNPRQ